MSTAEQKTIPARRVGERVKFVLHGNPLTGTVEWADRSWVRVGRDDGFIYAKPSDVYNEVGDRKLADRLRDMASKLVDEAIRIEDEFRARGS